MSKAPLLIASLVMGAGSALMEMDGQRRYQKDQEGANARWLDYQRKARDRARGVEESERGQAWDQIEGLIDANTQESREAAIEAGTEDLTERFGQTVGIDDFGTDARGSGQEEGRSGEFDTALAAELNKASGDVRQRLQSLARASAYGAPGMGSSVEDAFRTSGNALNAINSRRAGNMDVLQAHRAVQPEIFEYKQSPLVPILQLGSTLTGLGAAGAFGGGGPNLFGAATTGGPGMTFGKGLNVADVASGVPRKLSFMNVPWNNNVVQF